MDCEAAHVVRTTSGSRVKERRNVGGGEHREHGERGEHSGGGVRGRTEGTGETGGKGTGSRNSHTLTEKEVEIGFQEVEKHNGKCIEMELNQRDSVFIVYHNCYFQLLWLGERVGSPSSRALRCWV